MKKPTRKTGKHPALAAPYGETELRKWCVEQATRWPTVYQGGGYAGAAGAYPPMQPAQHVDVNLLARAGKILDWVKSK